MGALAPSRCNSRANPLEQTPLGKQVQRRAAEGQPGSPEMPQVQRHGPDSFWNAGLRRSFAVVCQDAGRPPGGYSGPPRIPGGWTRLMVLVGLAGLQGPCRDPRLETPHQLSCPSQGSLVKSRRWNWSGTRHWSSNKVASCELSRKRWHI